MDPIILIVSERELKLIAAMRKVVSQDDKYKVTITTKNDSINRVITEYSDTFEV